MTVDKIKGFSTCDRRSPPAASAGSHTTGKNEIATGYLDRRPSEFCNDFANGNKAANVEELTQNPLTLGDVLYAKSRPAVLEQDWVDLVKSIAAGDQTALHALYAMAHRVVFTLVIRITSNRETAEELTVDVFHDIWRRASRYDAENGTVLAWIMNQARSRAVDRMRFDSRKKRSPVGDAEFPAEPVADPRDVLQLREQGRALRKALTVLTSDERQVIEVTFFEGLTHVEAATRLNQPLGTIKTRIRSGLHKLRHALDPEEVKS